MRRWLVLGPGGCPPCAGLVGRGEQWSVMVTWKAGGRVMGDAEIDAWGSHPGWGQGAGLADRRQSPRVAREAAQPQVPPAWARGGPSQHQGPSATCRPHG